MAVRIRQRLCSSFNDIDFFIHSSPPGTHKQATQKHHHAPHEKGKQDAAYGLPLLPPGFAADLFGAGV